jgi:hypothetical protein
MISGRNWVLNDAGAFDYVADQKGYTWGSAVELNQKNWAIRAGYFLEPDVPNGNNFDTRIFERGQWLCHVWMAPADQGLFCGGAFDRGCGHVFGLSMLVLTPGWP